MSKARNINFIGQSKPLITLSVLGMLGSWWMISTGMLELGIDFAGGTEALVSAPSDVEVSDAELQEAAKSVGLIDPQVISYSFQDNASAQGFFIRSKSAEGKDQSGLARDKGDELRDAISSNVGTAATQWDEKANTSR